MTSVGREEEGINTLYEKNAFSKELKKSNIESTCKFTDPSLSRYQSQLDGIRVGNRAEHKKGILGILWDAGRMMPNHQWPGTVNEKWL